jgi:hypothetical protein
MGGCGFGVGELWVSGSRYSTKADIFFLAFFRNCILHKSCDTTFRVASMDLGLGFFFFGVLILFVSEIKMNRIAIIK